MGELRWRKRHHLTGRTVVGILVGVFLAGVLPAAEPPDLADPTPLAEPPSTNHEIPRAFRNQQPPGRASREFTTDFSRATVSFADVFSGGPPKDGIPAIDRPNFVSGAEATQWIAPNEPVMVVEARVIAGSTDLRSGAPLTAVHIYPLQILTWHEIVNDVIDGIPVTVTYCPLCNTGIVFDRRAGATVLDFGTTGRLRFSNLIMYDRQTESWWQQASGRSLAGHYAGARLRVVPSMMVSFADALERWPNARVLSRDTGHHRAYGANPYVGYDSADEPFLFRGPPVNGALNPMDRVISISHNDETIAVTYRELREEHIVQRRVGGEMVVVLWERGTTSALDGARIADSEDVGTANAFFPRTQSGARVELVAEGGAIVDLATGSQWTVTGHAVRGPRAGERLTPATGTQHFWFSHTAFLRE